MNPYLFTWCSRVGLLVALVSCLIGCSGAVTQVEPAPPARGDAPGTVRVAASARYRAGRVHRFIFGGGYRDLWKAEVELPLLDLEKEGGGLTPTGRFGGLQSAVLGLVGADGRRYTFRGTDKDPSAVLHPMLRDSPVRDLVQDQMAAQHPGGPLVAGELSEAVGVLTIRERMVVMPDDPALGAYRKEFAGMVGTFYTYPTPREGNRPGFAGATEIVDQEALYARLEASHVDRVDAEAYLRARLLDLLLGDFDRHRKQWRWAKLPGEPEWQPIPEDRDQAFVRYDGVGQRIGAIYVPILQCYGSDYPAMRGLAFHGWEQDRWLLASLEWSAWERVIQDLKRRLTDDAIERALRQLPPAYYALDAERLRGDIRGRRDRWLEGGRAFYEHLAGEVNVQASDAAEAVAVTWTPDGKLRVEVRPRVEGSEAFFDRTFDPSETHDVRIYLRGGDDRVVVEGVPGSIALRVVSDRGQKVLDDSSSGGTAFYDVEPTNVVRKGASTSVVDDDYVPPDAGAGFLEDIEVPPRDWGWDLLPFPNLGYAPGVGFMLGAGVQVSEFGFRKHPFSRSHRASVEFATGTLLPTALYSGRYRFENSNVIAELDVGYDGNAVIRYHGLGNETAADQPDDFYNVILHRVSLSPAVSWTSSDEILRLAGGLVLTYSSTQTEDEPRLIGEEQPYGSGRFFQSSLFGHVMIDLRRSEFANHPLALPLHTNTAAGYATGGVLLDLRADVTPPVPSAEAAWGSVDASVAGYLGLMEGSRLVLTGRLGERFTWGRVPYFGAAFLGGGGFFSGGATARGFIAQRFAGDASLYANADARLFLFRFPLLVPTDFGITGFGDVGRVFAYGESSDRWHPSGGGGIWLAPLTRTNTISFSVAGSRDNVNVYGRAGFHY